MNNARKKQAPEELEDRLNAEVTFEPRDLTVSSVAAWGAVLLIVLLLSQLMVWRVFRSMQATAEESQNVISPLRVGLPATLPPEPRLQGAPGHPQTGPQDLQSTVSQASAQLNSYGWVDQTAGMAHIPVTEAMDLIVEDASFSISGAKGAVHPPAARPAVPPTPAKSVAKGKTQ